jgi:acyl carrier protein phosphodiesterase
MNYLAHLFLAHATPESMTGNLLADFVKGNAILELPHGVQDGVRMHRAVDRFTDSHPIVRQSRSRLDARWVRVSGILMDVYYDYILARQWGQYCSIALRQYLDLAYVQLLPVSQTLPERFGVTIRRMVHEDLMMSYVRQESIHRALRSISHRLRNGKFRLEESLPDLLAHDQELTADFHVFFTELVTYARQWKPGAR